MSRPTLWRLDSLEPALPETALSRVVSPYLMHGPLTIVLVRIDDAQRVYLLLHGCAGCATGRCVPGCHADLLRRALLAERIGELTPAPSGLAKRPYQRLAYAVPMKRADALTPDFLAPWREARLLIHWRRTRRSGTSCAAVLLVGASGPSPVARLRTQHWWALGLPRVLGRRTGAPAPIPFLLARRWRKAPFLPLPRSVPATPLASEKLEPLTIDGLLTEWLSVALDAPHALRAENQVRNEAPEPPDTSGWPAGPGGITPALLAALVPQLLAEPSFRSERAGQSGITKGRLANLKHALLPEPTARALMVWFDRAGVLAPTTGSQSPWRAPRTFATDDVAQIAERLRATALPSHADVQAAYGGD